MIGRKKRFACAINNWICNAHNLQAKHLRDKLGKLVRFGFDDTSGPALFSDLVIAYKFLGVEQSGLSGTVIDQSDSTQNNRRAEGMASFELVRALNMRVPGARGTASFALVSAMHLRAFKDSADSDPICTATRIAMLTFSHTFHILQVLATKKRAELILITAFRSTV